MASGDFGPPSTRKRVGVDPSPQLPSKPAVTGPVAIWVEKIGTQLRFAFSRYGMATNALSEMEDQDKLRARFVRRA